MYMRISPQHKPGPRGPGLTLKREKGKEKREKRMEEKGKEKGREGRKRYGRKKVIFFCCIFAAYIE